MLLVRMQSARRVGAYHPAVFDKEADSIRGVSIQGILFTNAILISCSMLKEDSSATVSFAVYKVSYMFR
jgi:hypothetical protein